MNLQRFSHFVAIAEEANFGRAATRIGIKQPPLSQSIRRLERDLGVILFERDAKGVRLTKAGEAFLPEARAAVSAAERAAALARSAASTRKPLRIGVISVALWEALPELLDVAQKADIPVLLEQKTTNEQLAALASGHLDFGFVAPPFEAPARLRVIVLDNEPVMVAVPAKLVRKSIRTIPLDLIAERLVLFPRVEGPALYDAILAMFRARRMKPKIVQNSTHAYDFGPSRGWSRCVFGSCGSCPEPVYQGSRISQIGPVARYPHLAGRPGPHAVVRRQRRSKARRAVAFKSKSCLIFSTGQRMPRANTRMVRCEFVPFFNMLRRVRPVVALRHLVRRGGSVAFGG